MSTKGTRRRWSLGRRVLAVLFLAAIAIPAVGATWGIQVVENAMIDRVRDGQLAAARSAASEARVGFSFALEFTKALAHRPGFVGWTAQGDVESQKKVLDNAYSTSQIFRTLATYDAGGRLISQNPLPLSSQNVLEGLQVGSARPLGDDAIVTVVEPISAQGELPVGTLVGEISLAKTMPGIRALRFGKTGTATLVSRDSTVLITGEADRLGKSLSDETLRGIASSGQEKSHQYFSRLVRREEIGTLAPVQGMPWSILITQATSEAFGPVREIRNALWLGVATLLFLALVIALIVARSFSRYEEGMIQSELAVHRYATEMEGKNQELGTLNESLKDFVSVASHDLRSPITSIVGFSSMLSKSWQTLSTDRREEFLEIIDRQSHLLLRIVEDLLAVSQIESGAMETHQQVLNVKEGVEEAIVYYSQTTPVKVSVPDNLNVMVDPDHFSRVVANLVGNAVKYGAPPIEIEARDGPGDVVEILVRDQGDGVPPEFTHRLFEKFSRANSGATRKEQGTGLGLSIILGLTRANGGDVWYETNSPRGSCFGIRLPATRLQGASYPAGPRVRASSI